jgi:hypothetical protein
MWYALTHHWNFARVMRVFIGIVILVQGLVNHDNGVIAMGGFFTLFGLFTTGCCGINGCNTTPTKMNQNDVEDVTFEVVKTKKYENE